jgi:bacillolysin
MKRLTTSRALILTVSLMAMFAAAVFTLPLLSRDGGTVTQAASGQNVVQQADAAVAVQTLNKLLAANAQIDARVSSKTGVYNFVRATSGVLATSSSLLTPEVRARAFLNANGGLLGMTDNERTLAAAPGPASNLALVSVVNDGIGVTHVKFSQRYQGLNVFGAQVVVHMKSTGITAVNGDYIPNVAVSTAPRITAAKAGAVALKQQIGNTSYTITKSELAIYRTGLLEGYRGQSVLAYAIEVTNSKATRDQIWIDATKGKILNRIALNPDGLNRKIYTPEMTDQTAVRNEGDPFTPGNPPGTTGADPINNLYLFAGQTYNLYSSGFGRDSYDGTGGTMHSVYLINDACPNAYWNGISTNYCPDFDADDVVSHEWSHGYTQYTHNLIYSYQSGAMNEAYSDIFGESVDLLNGVDAEGGADNTQVMPNGQRWQMGEDVNGLNQPAAGILRDMWDPTRYSDPDKVSSENYACGAGDGGGVHTNSGVVNHAFAMLVDGKTFNGQTVVGIGFTRALAIYYRAMTVYQTQTSDFNFHALALHASCQDLIGQPLKDVTTNSATGSTSAQVITATHCQQVDKAMLAVEMQDQVPCAVAIVLDPEDQEACPGNTDIFVEDWESGEDGWTKTSTGVFPTWTTDDTVAPGNDQARLRNFNPTTTYPAGGGSGTVLKGPNPQLGQDGGGDCSPTTADYSGQYTIDSPTITLPPSADAKLRFDHYVLTEAGWDGAQVELSVNGGSFALVPAENFVFNSPNSELFLTDGNFNPNTNPNRGEAAWTGRDIYTPSGSPPAHWGTTIVDLSSLTNPGDTIKIRFTFSQDGCNGFDGWYIDNIHVYSCPLLEAPTLSLGADYENPDSNGSYTLNWTRPATATGPDVLQESTVCGPLLTENAENGLGQWTVAGQGTPAQLQPTWTAAPANAKPGYDSATFWAHGTEETLSSSTTLTFNNPITIPPSGTTTLSFSEWYFNEDDERGTVEVSTDNGINWTAIYTNARPMGDLPDAGADAFANEGFTQQVLNLTPYSGQTIRLRFKYFIGGSDFTFFVQYGWYIDNISIVSDAFADLTNADVTSFLVSGRSNGTRCYRARTSYDFGAGLVKGPYSALVSATTNIVCTVQNIALAAAGSIADATSSHSSGLYPASGAINGNHIGNDWDSGGGWNDGTRAEWPDTLEVNFGTSRSIDEIRVYTLQNDWQNGVEPTETTSASAEGIIDFTVEYWNGSAWVQLPGGSSVTGNDKAMRVFQFTQVTTTKIRVIVTAARNNWSRIVEVEAKGCN